MSPLPMIWYLICSLSVKRNVALAYSEGTDTEDAIRNYGEQSGAPTGEDVVAVLWPHDRGKEPASYPTTRV